MARRTFPQVASTPPYHSQEIASFGEQPEAATSMLNEELRRIASSNQDLYDKLGKLEDVFSALGIDVDKFDPSKNKGGESTGIPNLDRLRYVINGPIGGEISRTGTVTNNPSVFNTTNTGGPGTNTTTTTIDKERVTEIVRQELPIPQPLKLFHSPGGPQYDQNLHSYSVAFEAIPLPGSKFNYTGLMFEGDTLYTQTADGRSYDTTAIRKLAHGVTSAWNDVTQPMNARRLFPSSWKYDVFPSGLPNLQNGDGSMKLPYMIIDTAYDNFGHAHVVKLAHAVDLISNALYDCNWFSTLSAEERAAIKAKTEDDCGDNLVKVRDPDPPLGVCVEGTGASAGHMVFAGTNVPCTEPRPSTSGTVFKDLILYNSGIEYRLESDMTTPITHRNQTDKWYNPSRRVYIGHGMTSQWTVGQTTRPYDPAKNNYFPAHRFYTGDWSSPVLANPSQAIVDLTQPLPNSRGTQRSLAPTGSVMVDMIADDWGHVQHAVFQQLQPLFPGRGLGMAFDGYYTPTAYNIIAHPQILTQHNQNNQKRFTGTPNWYPSDFTTNDSGHLTAVHWSQLPVIQGPKGDDGNAATIALFVEATNTLPPLSPASVTRTNYGNIYNANYGLTFNIPAGQTGPPGGDGTNGTNGTNGAPATVAALINTVTTGTPNVTVANWGTSQNALFAFDFVLPPGSGTGTGDIYNITNNNVYNSNIQNIGYYGSWRSLVYNPGSNNPTYIKRVAAEDPALFTFEVGDTVIFGHKSPSSYYSSTDWTYFYSSGFNSPSAYIEPKNNGDGTWTFPGIEMNGTGHIINAYPVTVPMGGGDSSYIWTVATDSGSATVPNNSTVRFLSDDPTKLSITQSSRDITFSLENAFENLIFGNGLSQDPNTPKTLPFEYDPYVGTTLHVNNNLKDVAGIVRKGSDPSSLEVTTKVWGTNNTNEPNWRPVIRLKGSRYVSLIEETPGVYAITLVN